MVTAARKPTRRTIARLHRHFPDIKIVPEAKYLGVVVGRDVTTIRIFQDAVDKFYGRAGQLRQIIRGSTLSQRILIYNTYLLPILFYLAQFYIIPYVEMVRPIMNYCRKDIAAFNGGIAYCHLINTPRTSFGPHTPLRDLWATNTALLASRSSMVLDSNGYNFPQTGDYAHVTAHHWNTLIIAEHEAYSAWLFLYDHGPRDSANNLHTDYIKGAPSTRRRHLYRQLIYYGYWQKRDVDSRTFLTSLPNKLRRFFPNRSTERLRGKVKQMKSNLTLAGTIPHTNQWNTFFRFITNVLPTDRRMAKADINPSNRNPLRSQACFFCNNGKDDVRHIFGTCNTIKTALRSTARAVGIRLPRHATMMGITTLTAAGTNPPSPLFPVLVLTFVWAVWSSRQRFFSALRQPPPPTAIAEHLETYTCTHLPQPQLKRTTPEAVIGLANNPPSEALVGFADGSSIPNPGPCGAGALLFLPNDAGTAISTISLGLGDNNLGEIAGLLEILRLVDEAYTKGRLIDHPALLLFTDSLLVVGALEWGWSTRNMPKLIGKLRKAYRKRKTLNSVALYWVKGHSQIIYNEVVDKRAKIGARWSQEGSVRLRTKWT